jgi:hypothetical protein
MTSPAKGRLSNVHAGKENAISAAFLKELPENARYRANHGEVFRIVKQGRDVESFADKSGQLIVA